MFIATGVTDGGLVDGVLLGPESLTESVVLHSRSGTFRRIVSERVADRWLTYESSVIGVATWCKRRVI